MGTTAEKLAYLADTKTAIKDAIVAKGVEVPEGTTFRQYADLISGISTGLSDADLALATATEDTVFNGKTFYAGDRTLRTGRALSTKTTAAARDILSGKTAYNELGQLITGTGRTVLAGSIGPTIEYKTYTISYGNNLGKPKAILAYFNVWVDGYATPGQQPSFSPYFFRGAVSGQLNGLSTAVSGTMRNQNQSSANTTLTINSDSFSVTFSKYDYVAGSEFCYICIW